MSDFGALSGAQRLPARAEIAISQPLKTANHIAM